jgi:ketosteroid isomerase-like protein
MIDTTIHESIAAIVDEYCQSIEAASVPMAEKIWLTTDDATFIHPRGHEKGFREIVDAFYVRAMGGTFSSRKLDPYDLVVHQIGDTVWAEFSWRFNAVFKDDGSPLSSSGRETQLYVLRDNRWLIAHVHYSGPPVGGAREGF